MHFFKRLNCGKGHIGKRSLKVISERNLLCDYVVEKLNECMCFYLDERRKVLFSIIVRKTTETVKLIHLDIRKLSRKSVRFMLTGGDDYSRNI